MDRCDLPTSRNTEPKRVFLWSTHRSLSSVLTKCIGAVEGMLIWVEPYQMCFENSQKPETIQTDDGATTEIPTSSHIYNRYHQQTEQGYVIEKTETTYDLEKYTYAWVKEQLELPQPRKKFVFVKELICTTDRSPIDEFLPDAVPYQHTFMVRHPIRVFTSFKKALTKEYGYDIEDITTDVPFYNPLLFYEQLYRRWAAVRESEGRVPVTIDAGQLLSNPEGTLSKYFEAVGFPWDKRLLHWDSGYERVGQWHVGYDYLRKSMISVWDQQAYYSTHFIKPDNRQQLSLEECAPDIRKCVENSMPYYNAIIANI